MSDCVICPYRRRGDCAQKGVVYQLECLPCGDLYVGETGRVLAIRVKEHLADERRQKLATPLGKHQREAHVVLTLT